MRTGSTVVGIDSHPWRVRVSQKFLLYVNKPRFSDISTKRNLEQTNQATVEANQHQPFFFFFLWTEVSEYCNSCCMRCSMGLWSLQVFNYITIRVTLDIHSNIYTVFIFKEEKTKLHTKLSFLIHHSPEPTILFFHLSSQMKMCLVTHYDFFVKIEILIYSTSFRLTWQLKSLLESWKALKKFGNPAPLATLGSSQENSTNLSTYHDKFFGTLLYWKIHRNDLFFKFLDILKVRFFEP